MPDPATAFKAFSTGVSLYSGKKASDTAKAGAESSERIAAEQAAVTREIAANAEALNRERFAEAQGLLLPRVGQSNIAQRQLMAEMGLPDYYGEQNAGYRESLEYPVNNQNADRIAEIRSQLEGIAPEAGSEEPRTIHYMGMDIPVSGSPSSVHYNGMDIPVSGPPSTVHYMGMDIPTSAQGSGQGVDQSEYDSLTRELESLIAEDEARAGSPPPGGEGYAPSRSYMDVPGYQAAMDESLRAVEQSAVSSGSTAYGGRRIQEAGKVGAGVQQSYYNNYMNMLQNMASPAVAQNLSSLGVGQAATIGQQNIQSGQVAGGYMIGGNTMANEYRMEGRSAKNAAIADTMGGITNMLEGYI